MLLSIIKEHKAQFQLKELQLERKNVLGERDKLTAFMLWRAIETNSDCEFTNGTDHFMTVNIKFEALSQDCDLKIIKSHASGYKLITCKSQEGFASQK